jgi:hypothetical protein
MQRVIDALDHLGPIQQFFDIVRRIEDAAP